MWTDFPICVHFMHSVQRIHETKRQEYSSIKSNGELPLNCSGYTAVFT